MHNQLIVKQIKSGQIPPSSLIAILTDSPELWLKFYFMTNVFLPQEEDFKKWVREALREELRNPDLKPAKMAPEEPLLSRQQIAAELGISLVTLTDWMKKGLPYLRLNGRVYFKRSEVIASMKHNVLKRN
jgi:hypothetical protein